jgi:PQQ-dependent catabolism-associated CXXCW motif protein
MNPKIFITYSSKDQKVSTTICRALEQRGIVCWISSRDVKPGQNYQEQIVKAIRSAKVMVLVFTANANNSNEIKKELALASQNSLIVIPVRIEDVTPNEAFAYEFATRQWIDMFDNWENSMGRLVDQIASAIDDHPPGETAKAGSGPRGGVAAKSSAVSAPFTQWPASRWAMIGGAAIIAAAALAYEDMAPPKQPEPVSMTAPAPSQPVAPTQNVQPPAQTAPAPAVAGPAIPDKNYANEHTNFGVAPQNFLQANVATPTPMTINGGHVVSTSTLYTSLQNHGNEILIDAWNNSGHPTLPNAVRLPAAGSPGTFNDAEQQRFVSQLRQLTGNNMSRALVFFCQGAQCWESYNAALRAISGGFKAVYWYRGGVLSWEAAGLPSHY